MTIHCVTLLFDAEAVTEPLLEIVAAESTLDGYLRRVADDAAWAWTLGDDAPLSLLRSTHLLQRIDVDPPFRVMARYLFDSVHAAAHPELIDREHVDILHGTLAAKLLDEGALVLEPEGIVASLTWVSTERVGTRLTRDGERTKRRP